jgi:hypothetical protein
MRQFECGRAISYNGGVNQLLQIVGCGIEYLESVNDQADESWLVYIDPPYPMESRSSQRDIYDFEMDDRDHARLLRVAKRLKCRVMVSSYANSRYQRQLRRWRTFTRWAMTRGGMRLEHLWCNFDPAKIELMPILDRAPGFRERERVKKKAKRWKRMLQECPDYERDFIYQQLGQVFNDA